MIQFEFPTRDQFHGRDEYQRWRAGFRPPAGTREWLDHEHQRPTTPRDSAGRSWGTLSYHWLFHTIQGGQHPCVDVGCGTHPLRGHGVWGVDPHNEPHRDEALTPGWWDRNRGRWARAFAVNSLHFGTVATVADNLRRFRALLSPDGRAVCALNRRRIWESEQHQNRSGSLIRSLRSMDGVTRVIWFRDHGAEGGPLSLEHAPMDGNVWIWFRA
jgi:hypothetical protein